MKLAFCLFHYFPFGGLQRDFLRIAQAAMRRGHEVTVYTSEWQGEIDQQLTIKLLPVSGWQNHRRYHAFVKKLTRELKNHDVDLIVGFNKMPGLDLYYAADVCYQSRIQSQRPLWYRLLPRYRYYLAAEHAVFSSQSSTNIMVLSAQQQAEYQRCYQIPSDRFYLLPPGIARDRMAPTNATQLRQLWRSAYGIQPEENVLLLAGSGFKTKGLDRVLYGLAALPQALQQNTQLWVLGQDHPKPFLRLAQRLKIADRVHFLGGQHQVTPFFLAADFLVHPAYHENTGTVLLEALAAGLPVLTVAVCGYAHYVDDAQAGMVLPAPFHQQAFNDALAQMLVSTQRHVWQQNGLAFSRANDIYSLPDKAVDIIESLAC